MAILSELNLYPIKSCAGIALKEATLTRAGLMSEQIYDREWMVVAPDGVALTQRDHPRMSLIVPKLKSETMELRAPGMLRLEIPLGLPDPDAAPSLQVQVWDDTVLAYDCDETTATWFSAFLGTPCRLVRFHANAKRSTSGKWTNGELHPTLFSDGYPILVIGTGSLEDLNEKLGKAGRGHLPMNRFRPNIVVGGLDPFEEDYTDTFAIGEALLKPVKPCARCPMPSVDQNTGELGPDPLDILQGYRAKEEVEGGICFGMNVVVVQGEGQQLKVGQEIGVTLAF